jgi:hypothetical protein
MIMGGVKMTFVDWYDENLRALLKGNLRNGLLAAWEAAQEAVRDDKPREETPKKIWYDFLLEYRAASGDHGHVTQYIRADLVDGLVEALQSIAREPREQSLEYGAKSLRDEASAALKTLEESNE